MFTAILKRSIVFCLCWLFPFTVYAQKSAEIHGTVTDELGGVITGAAVTLDDGQGHRYDLVTDDKGRYNISTITPGKYLLTVSLDGYEPFLRKVSLPLPKNSAADVKLTIQISEELEVKADDVAVSTEPDKNLTAIVLNQKDLEALSDDPDELLSELREMAGGSTGGPDDAVVYIDGFRDNGRLPPKESILSVRINSNPFSAEYSEPGTSRIEIITKPGSDRYHGGFRFNFNDESLNARNAFALFRAPLQIRNFSGNIGGPIIKNRWSFLFDFERRSQDENDVISATVLDPVTLAAQPFSTTVLTPSLITNFTGRTDFLLNGNQSFSVQFRRTSNTADNQGLQGGFDLPERGFDRTLRDDTLRFSLTSILNEKSVNELRLQLDHRVNGQHALDTDPAVVVLDSFSEGGNQGSLFSNSTSNSMELTDNYSYTLNKHTFKTGVRVTALHVENFDRANFGGTFTFGTDFDRDAQGLPKMDRNGEPIVISALEHYRRVLEGLPGYRPSQFSIVTGDPFIAITQWETSLFALDDWRISPRLTFSYGLREEFQTHLQDKLNFAPRVAVAFAPDKARKSTIRAGAGIFYNSIDNGVTLDTSKFDGLRQEQFVIRQPDFFATIPSEFSTAEVRRATTRIKEPDLHDPYSILATISYERQLPGKLFGAISYTWQRGVHLLRTRNINAPIRTADGVIFPDPNHGPLLEYESSGLSTRHEMKISVRTNLTRTYSLFANYILSSTRSDTDGLGTSPSDPYDLTDEFGRAGIDQRHRAFIGGSISFPHGMRVSPFFTASTGRPFNITTGRDNNGDTLFTDRPAFATADTPGAIITPYGIFNANPRPGDLIIPRNYGEGPAQITLNLSFSKTFGFGAIEQSTRQGGGGGRGGGFGGGMRGGGPGGGNGGGGGGSDTNHRYSLAFTINMQNILNHTNLAGYNGSLSSPFFGRANRASAARRIELALRFNF